MSMTVEESNEFQSYLQMYDKGLVSKKTVLAKIGIKWEDEKKDIEKDIKFDTERFSPNYPSDDASCCCKGEPGGESLDIILDVGKNTDRVKIMGEQISAISFCIDKMSQSINKVREVVDLEVKKLSENAIIPAYAHEGDAGFDLSAIVFEKNDSGYADKAIILPGQKYIAKTGLAFAVPAGYELQVRPRSGLAYKHGITVINSPGTVDSGYRGEVMVILLNTGTEPFVVQNGDRIAQAVINKLPKVIIREVEDLDKTERGSGGFGSTGK